MALKRVVSLLALLASLYSDPSVSPAKIPSVCQIPGHRGSNIETVVGAFPEDSIAQEAVFALKKVGKDVSRNSISIEQIQQDMNLYDTIRATYPLEAHSLSEKYKQAGNQHWYGFISANGQTYATLFSKGKEEKPVFLEFMEPVNPQEMRFIRNLNGLSDVLPSKLKIDYQVERRIHENYNSFLDSLIVKAKQEPDYGKQVADVTIQQVRRALEHAGKNKVEFLKAMSVMDSTELVLACHLLPRMDNPIYGFRAETWEQDKKILLDLQHQTAEVFLDDIRTASQILSTFPWARNEAASNWDNFVSGVVVPRTTGEYNVGGRSKLLGAVADLVGDAKTPEDALTRIVDAAHKWVRYSSGYGSAYGNITDYGIAHLDRCGVMSLFGNSLIRAAGIPIYRAHTPWWANASNNHAWNMVQLTRSDGGIEFYSFLVGDKNEHNGKPNLHVFDMFNPHLKRTDSLDGELIGLQGTAKVYLVRFMPESTEKRDITDQVTSTTSVPACVGSAYADKTVYLNVVNEGQLRTVAAASVNEEGSVTFANVGYVPRTITSPDGADLRDDLVYAVTDASNDPYDVLYAVGNPFKVDGNEPCVIQKPFKLYNRRTVPLNLALSVQSTSVNGFEPNICYRAETFTDDGFVPLGMFTSDQEGKLQAPVASGSLTVFRNTANKDAAPYVVNCCGLKPAAFTTSCTA